MARRQRLGEIGPSGLATRDSEHAVCPHELALDHRAQLAVLADAGEELLHELVELVLEQLVTALGDLPALAKPHELHAVGVHALVGHRATSPPSSRQSSRTTPPRTSMRTARVMFTTMSTVSVRGSSTPSDVAFRQYAQLHADRHDQRGDYDREHDHASASSSSATRRRPRSHRHGHRQRHRPAGTSRCTRP